MAKPLTELSSRREFLAVGLMSGTSMDGVDAALVRMPAGDDLSALELVAFQSSPYPDELRSALRDAAFGEQCATEDIAVLNTSVAVAFANAFHTVVRSSGVEADAVDFIGSHGQTVAHAPPAEDGMNLIAGTLQLGPPGMIAALTGVTTVGDFRVADIALGGQGAPLAPYVDFLMRKSKAKSRVILNIGGIANVTYLPKNCGLDEVIAFDTGPGNMILDELYRVIYPNETGYEELAAHIANGEPSQSLVGTFLNYAFFEQPPPKSAGHREFGAAFAWEFLAKGQTAGLKREDLLASAVTLTTRSIFDAIEAHLKTKGEIDQVFISGGGSHNRAMVEELSRLLDPIEVSSIDELGIPADAKEAVDFAVLARETVLSRRNVIRAATGASRAAVLGTIALGSIE